MHCRLAHHRPEDTSDDSYHLSVPLLYCPSFLIDVLNIYIYARYEISAFCSDCALPTTNSFYENEKIGPRTLSSVVHLCSSYVKSSAGAGFNNS